MKWHTTFVSQLVLPRFCTWFWFWFASVRRGERKRTFVYIVKIRVLIFLFWVSFFISFMLGSGLFCKTRVLQFPLHCTCQYSLAIVTSDLGRFSCLIKGKIKRLIFFFKKKNSQIVSCFSSLEMVMFYHFFFPVALSFFWVAFKHKKVDFLNICFAFLIFFRKQTQKIFNFRQVQLMGGIFGSEHAMIHDDAVTFLM